MILVALNEAAARGELLLVEGGLCRFHRRRDGVVVIRELLVLPPLRRQGIGRTLLRQAQAAHPGDTLRARCPVGYPSNGFWRACGFGIAYVEGGVNVWERYPA